MRSIYLLLILFSVLVSQNLASQTWTIQNNPGIGGVIRVRAISNDTAFAMTGSQILKTTNSGSNWLVIHSHTNVNDSTFNEWSWVNNDLIYAGMWWSGGFYRSTNGGNSWSHFSGLGGGWVRARDFQFMINQNQDTIGFKIHEYSNYLFISTTAGRTWNNFTVPVITNLSSLHFLNDQTGWVTGWGAGSNGIILKTTNRGFTWLTQYTNLHIADMFFLSENIGYGSYPGNNPQAVYKTTNGGTNWTMLVTSLGYTTKSLFFHDVNSGWFGVSSTNGLYKTTNGGLNWVQQNLGLSNVNINNVSFFGYNRGWAVGSFSDGSALILRTTNGSGVNPPAIPILVSPPNFSTGQSITPYLDWDTIAAASTYRIQLSNDSLFGSTLIDSGNLSVTFHQVAPGILQNNVKYWWRVKAYNIGGESPWSAIWNFRTGFVGVNQTGTEIPERFNLYTNYPNPFNPVTTIRFDIPEQSFTKLVIYDLQGKEIKTLVHMHLQAGSYTAQLNAEDLSSGIYFYRIETGKFIDVKKMILVK